MKTAAPELVAAEVSSSPVKRAASRLRKARSARSAREALETSVERSEKVAEAVAVVSEVAHAHHEAKARPPRKRFLNAVCFWAGSVLSDGSAFLRQKAG